jgi:iron complex outermembrane recepter protein
MNVFRQKRHGLRLAVLMVGIAWCATTVAQEAEKPDGEKPAKKEERVLRLDRVVVQGSKIEEEGERQIESKALKMHKVVDMAEILADEMVEAAMIRKAGYGNEVSIRGFGKSNLRITLDEGLLEGACGARKDPSLCHVNMLTVDTVEVRQGPFDVTKPGALGGSINVVTRKPEKDFHGEVLGKMGSFGYWSTGGYVTGGNDWVQGLFGYTYSESGQYEDGDGNELYTFTKKPYQPQYEDMDAFSKHDVWGKLQLTPAPDHTFLFEYTYGDAEDIMYPRGVFDIPHERTYLGRASYTATDLGAWSEKLTLSVYQNTVKHYPSMEYRTAPNVAKPTAISRITGGQIENETETEFATFTYGVDVYHRNWHGNVTNNQTGAVLNPVMIPDVDSLNLGVYVQAEKEIGDLTLAGGTRYDWHEQEVNRTLSWGPEAGNQPSRRDDAPSGFLSATYRFSERVEAFGGLGHSVRMPTSIERFLQGGGDKWGNPDLDPVKNTELDLGVTLKLDPVTIRAKAFYSYLTDYIYQYQDNGGNYTWTNIDATIWGGDVKATVQLPAGFSVEGGIAYQRGRKEDQPPNNNDSDLAEIAPWKSKLALNYDRERFFATVEWIYSDKARYVDTDALEQELAAWNVVNLRAGYEFKGGITWNVGVNNLFDEDYAVANSYEWEVFAGGGVNPAVVDEPGRFFYTSLSYRF